MLSKIQLLARGTLGAFPGSVAGSKRLPSGFDNLVDEYVAAAMTATGTAPAPAPAPARLVAALPLAPRPAMEPLPRHRAARASVELTYQVQAIQTLLDETLAELDEEAETNVDIPACPMIRGGERSK